MDRMAMTSAARAASRNPWRTLVLRNAVVGVYPLPSMVPKAEAQAWADYSGSPVIIYDVDPGLGKPELGAPARPSEPGWREVCRHEPAAGAATPLRASVASGR
jgi:hypothetical protein